MKIIEITTWSTVNAFSNARVYREKRYAVTFFKYVFNAHIASHLNPTGSSPVCILDFCAGKRHQFCVACAGKSSESNAASCNCLNGTENLAPRIELSPKCDHRMHLILCFGAFVGGNSLIGAVNRAFSKFWRMCRWEQWKWRELIPLCSLGSS